MFHLCSREYEIFKSNLKYIEMNSICLVLGICSPNQSFEKMMLQDFELCENCANLFKQIYVEYTVLSDADRKIIECVKTFKQRVLDRKV